MNKRIVGLDLLRSIAIINVVAVHLCLIISVIEKKFIMAANSRWR